MTEMIPLETIRAAQERLEKLVHKTPLERNHTFSTISEREVYLKLENLQRTGSFKVRGASNCIMTLSEEQKAKGIIAASAGNHAQGVALGSRMAHCKSTVVMPEGAPWPRQKPPRATGRKWCCTGRPSTNPWPRPRRSRRKPGLFRPSL